MKRKVYRHLRQWHCFWQRKRNLIRMARKGGRRRVRGRRTRGGITQQERQAMMVIERSGKATPPYKHQYLLRNPRHN
jgi:hypothetical protein